MESFEDFRESTTDQGKSNNAQTIKDSSPPQDEIESHEASGSSHGLDPMLQEQRGTKDLEEGNTYPHLSNNPPEMEKRATDSITEDDEEEPLTSSSFERSSDPNFVQKRNSGAFVSKVGDEGVMRMHKFTLYETATFFYIVGTNLLDTSFRIMKIDRTADEGDLIVAEDDIVYNKTKTQQILNAIDEGNKATGGLKLKVSFWGLLGFIRFTGPYYMIFVTKRSQVAMIGGHYIYQVNGTELMPLTMGSYSRGKTEKTPEEARFVGILNNLDLTRSFYFSYSYDITRTLQHNIMRERQALQDGLAEPLRRDHNEMFVWNHHLLEPATAALHNPYDWCLSVVHGYVDQSALSVYWGRVVYVTIIARRSRYFAGARYLKRGANDLGYVANDVETEQIVSEMLTTSFHAPGPTLFANPNYTSHVQHRGSIPLYWTQDSTAVSPKPDIHLSVVDPFFSAAALHFDNLFKRYGAPVYVLNLIKARERNPRESKLLKEYTTAVGYLNQFLPDDKKIIYLAWDMSRASKSRDQDVIGELESIAEGILPKTGFFQNGNDEASGLKLQCGVARTNCIDCLDRTNAAQFVIAKKAFGYQLQALGVIEDTSVEYDSDAVNLFTHMWHDHGDTIAVQYGGSHLVNTMATYRKINQWTSHSRDMVESFKRYYNNSFMDAQRQEAYNLFLGNYVYMQGQPMLWEMSTDYYLHHSDPRSMFGKDRPGYRQWYTPEYLSPPGIPPAIWPQELSKKPLDFFDDYWVEYYRPISVSSFQKIFSFKMHSNLRYIPINSTAEGRYDLSPFKVRTSHENEPKTHDKGKTQRRKGVTIVAPSDQSTLDTASSIDARISSPTEATPKPSTLGPWLDAQQQLYGQNRKYTGIIKEASFEVSSLHPAVPPIPLPDSAPSAPTKAEIALDGFTRLVANSLDPSVPDAEEYERYVAHPMNIPLVVSSDIDYSKTPAAFLEYLSKTQEIPDIGNVVGYGIEERAEASTEDYAEFLEIPQDGLTVLDEDATKQRYKAYRKWMRGKSLFKQRPNRGEIGEGVTALG